MTWRGGSPRPSTTERPRRRCPTTRRRAETCDRCARRQLFGQPAGSDEGVATGGQSGRRGLQLLLHSRLRPRRSSATNTGTTRPGRVARPEVAPERAGHQVPFPPASRDDALGSVVIAFGADGQDVGADGEGRADGRVGLGAPGRRREGDDEGVAVHEIGERGVVADGQGHGKGGRGEAATASHAEAATRPRWPRRTGWRTPPGGTSPPRSGSARAPRPAARAQQPPRPRGRACRCRAGAHPATGPVARTPPFSALALKRSCSASPMSAASSTNSTGTPSVTA